MLHLESVLGRDEPTILEIRVGEVRKAARSSEEDLLSIGVAAELPRNPIALLWQIRLRAHEVCTARSSSRQGSERLR
jgi:hypothetical protein